MALGLFVIGTLLYLTGRFSFGSLRTQGRHVKVAGAILMTPVIGGFFLGLIIASVFAGAPGVLGSLIGVIAILELVGAGTAAWVAYILLADPARAPRLPGFLGEVQAERRQQNSVANPSPTPLKRHPLERATVANAPRRVETEKRVLSVTEAANYMNVSPAEIMDWINAGRLPAARDNSGYAIARSRLDELKS